MAVLQAVRVSSVLQWSIDESPLKFYVLAMNEMGISMQEYQGRLRPMAMVIGPTALNDSVKELRSWDHADDLARDFGLDPRMIVWGPGTLDWCKSEWGEPPTRN